ncbi:MAG: hypothetical protein E7231_02300 [Cellulosilyticum sp.]|nr:hypothetical protein [Cellulosilyticum sp.]
MQAFHSNWTKPFFSKHVGAYYIEDFELLTTILSALTWQEFNGDIQMITDEIGAAYYHKLGIEKIWNLGIDDSLESKMKGKIDPSTFWAAGKLYALEKQNAPCVMLDTDFIIWKPIEEELKKHELTVIHRESLQEDVYPNKEKLMVRPSYQYPVNWDWSLEACNTAFTFFNNEAFKAYYVDESIRFMEGVVGEDPLIYMVFAEQRLLAMCAEEKEIDIYAFSNTEDLFHSNQEMFTHIWGYKRYIRSNPLVRENFCKRCIARIQNDYPMYYPLLYRIESLIPYLK